MNERTRKRLRSSGWTVGTTEELLGLSKAEARLIEIRLALAQGLRTRRERLGLTQAAIAGRLGSSQSRVAKMETGDPTVSIDLLVRALLALGVLPRELGRLIGTAAA